MRAQLIRKSGHSCTCSTSPTSSKQWDRILVKFLLFIHSLIYFLGYNQLKCVSLGMITNNRWIVCPWINLIAWFNLNLYGGGNVATKYCCSLLPSLPWMDVINITSVTFVEPGGIYIVHSNFALTDSAHEYKVFPVSFLNGLKYHNNQDSFRHPFIWHA